MEIDKKKETYNWEVVEPEGMGTFTGRQPRQVALKVANRSNGTKENPIIIKIRKKGTKKLHVFEGYKQEISNKRDNRPAWLGDMVNKPFVKKIRIEEMEDIDIL